MGGGGRVGSDWRAPIGPSARRDRQSLARCSRAIGEGCAGEVCSRAVKPPQDFVLSRASAALVSAALRHIRDAERLASPGDQTSPDQAYHLAGFGPECARKATFLARWLDQALGHDFGDPGEGVLDLATAFDPVALRYRPLDFKSRYPALATWVVGSRYEKTGTRTTLEAARICEQARSAVDSVVIGLWLDGRWPDGETLE